MLVSSQGPVLLIPVPSRDTPITVTHAHHPLPCLTPSWPSSPAQAGSLALWSACFGLLFPKLSRTCQLIDTGNMSEPEGPRRMLATLQSCCSPRNSTQAGRWGGRSSLLTQLRHGSPLCQTGVLLLISPHNLTAVLSERGQEAHFTDGRAGIQRN